MTRPPSDLSDLIDRYWEQRPDIFGSVEDINQTLTCREGDQFLITDTSGNAGGGNRTGLGLYGRDTRHLSAYDLMIDGYHPLVLLSTAESGYSQEQILGNHMTVAGDTVVGRASIEIRRRRTLGDPLTERLSLTNYNQFSVVVRPAYLFAADFADVFQIRGHKRRHEGKLEPPVVTGDSIRYSYTGADHIERHTLIEFKQPPEVINARGAAFALEIGPKQTCDIDLTIYGWQGERRPQARTSPQRLQRDYSKWRDSFVSVRTDNQAFNEVLERSVDDLRMLWTEGDDGSYFAAGVPWYSTLFGRDSLITALQLLPFKPDAAKDCLQLLAKRQGTRLDEARDEAPGKILHEVRNDELSNIGELPYARYFGSVDSTPLFVLLAGEYFRWTADRKTFEALMPALEAALTWIEKYGDLEDDGYVRYRTDSNSGLRNQGWKDSVDGVVDAEGRRLEGPIALAEVQSYVYGAYRSLASALLTVGRRQRAAELIEKASLLRQRFNRDFWLRDRGLVAMALDGEGRPADVVSSNAGQVLWSGILEPEIAETVRDSLMSNEMFTGWGIRTLSSDTPSYSPLGYHVGTVWPHDNGIIAHGFKIYGFDEEVSETATALFDASRQFPLGRLPELFGGQPRTKDRPPIPYPVACRPQAWTAGTFFHLLSAMLGIYPDAANRRLHVIRPQLPEWLREVHLSGLQVGSGNVDLYFSQGRKHASTTVLRAQGVRVVRGSVEPVRRWG
ncbi:MAG TPA: amylo-alpha-1,6-glucosidase [Dehalococcoidia bacterium]|nr:amylo-alpha-1,6-glucosidase [Dehalococcoidia bacterium]